MTIRSRLSLEANIYINIYYTSKLKKQQQYIQLARAGLQGQRCTILACALLRYLAWNPVVDVIQQWVCGSEVHVSCILATFVTSPSHCSFSGQPWQAVIEAYIQASGLNLISDSCVDTRYKHIYR